ncbi:MAG: right-handed parallel beta-helix repeat-containing protein [bacterium]
MFTKCRLSLAGLALMLFTAALILGPACGEKGVESGKKEGDEGDKAEKQVKKQPRDHEKQPRRANKDLPRAAAPKGADWKGDGPLSCDGDKVYKIQDKTIDQPRMVIQARGNCDITLINCKITSKRMTIRIGGKASLTVKGGSIKSGFGTALHVEKEARVKLENVELKGRVGMRVEDQARAILKGGKVHGRYAAAIAYGKGAIAYQGTQWKGEKRAYRGGVVVEVPKGDDPEMVISQAQVLAIRNARYEKGGCEGFIDCYADNGSHGRISGKVTMPVEKDGTIKRPKLKLRRANGKTKKCIRELIKEKKIANFEGPPGKLICSFSGTVRGGLRMISTGTEFVPNKKGK